MEAGVACLCQESIQTVASSDDVDFETQANLSINDLTEKAFYELDNDGHIKMANDHSCSECTKPFKESVTDTTIHLDVAPVKMVVLDGIVMGPTHCAFPGCISDLQNTCGDAFCTHHEFEFGSKCCVIDCPNNKIEPTEACQAHASEWRKNVHSDYICIDKAFQVMPTSVNNGSWNTWMSTSPITTLIIVQVMNYVEHIAIQPQ